jgi:hypothetical protein
METDDRFYQARAFVNIGLHDGLPHWMYVLDLQRSRLRQLQAEGRRLGELIRGGQLLRGQSNGVMPILRSRSSGA